jgi:hypothetical protein
VGKSYEQKSLQAMTVTLTVTETTAIAAATATIKAHNSKRILAAET